MERITTKFTNGYNSAFVEVAEAVDGRYKVLLTVFGERKQDVKFFTDADEAIAEHELICEDLRMNGWV